MEENRDSECLQEIAKSLAHIEQLLQDMPERLLKRVPDMYLALRNGRSQNAEAQRADVYSEMKPIRRGGLVGSGFGIAISRKLS